MPKILQMHNYVIITLQVVIVALVIIDCLIVIAELLLEVKHHELHDSVAPHVSIFRE